MHEEVLLVDFLQNGKVCVNYFPMEWFSGIYECTERSSGELYLLYFEHAFVDTAVGVFYDPDKLLCRVVDELALV
jgi:hypothetical protein